jgi:hypothetical protein
MPKALKCSRNAVARAGNVGRATMPKALKCSRNAVARETPYITWEVSKASLLCCIFRLNSSSR